MAEGFPGAHDRCVEVHWLVAVEAETRAGVGAGIVGRHGVHQPAHLAHHRDRAVAHRQQLADAAGLEAAGHQEGIRAAVDQAGEGIVVGEEHREAAGVAGRHLPEARFVAAITRAEHHELAVGVGQHPIGHLQQ